MTNPLPWPVLFILLSLGSGPAHGYAIMKQMEADGLGSLGATSLYRNIGVMLKAGLIEETAAPTAGDYDARRVYYRLTEAGERALGEQVAWLRGIVEKGEERKFK